MEDNWSWEGGGRGGESQGEGTHRGETGEMYVICSLRTREKGMN